MVGKCGNTSLGQGEKFLSCPVNVFRITTTNSSTAGHKGGDRVRDIYPTPLGKEASTQDSQKPSSHSS